MDDGALFCTAAYRLSEHEESLGLKAFYSQALLLQFFSVRSLSRSSAVCTFCCNWGFLVITVVSVGIVNTSPGRKKEENICTR